MENLKERTFKFSNEIIRFVEILPENKASKVVSFQLLKSATSVGANYRAAKRARSDKEFISKINIVLEEVDESLYWLEIIKEQQWIEESLLEKLIKESDELTAIFTTTLITMNKKVNNTSNF